ncbi:MAG: 4'-phosphopantetheinyl transferase superfamily protein [Bacteroidota bacterium]
MKFITPPDYDFWPSDTWLTYATIDQPDAQVLTRQEKEEWKALSVEKRKQEFAAGRVLLHEMLEHLQVTGLNDRTWEKNDLGKPHLFIQGTEWGVSFSHSSTLVFCALSKHPVIGLDVESDKRMVSTAVLKRVLNPSELPLTERVPPLTLWTLKEAAVKAVGLGLGAGLASVTLKEAQKSAFLAEINEEVSLSLCSFTLVNHQISFAHNSKRPNLVIS